MKYALEWVSCLWNTHWESDLRICEVLKIRELWERLLKTLADLLGILKFLRKKKNKHFKYSPYRSTDWPYFFPPFLPLFPLHIDTKMMWGKQWNALNFLGLGLLNRFFLGKGNLPQHSEIKNKKNTVKCVVRRVCLFVFHQSSEGILAGDNSLRIESENIVEGTSEGKKDLVRLSQER